MRYTLTLILLLFCLIVKAQSPEITTSYVLSVPRGNMQDNITHANGFNIDFYYTPKAKRFSFGTEMNFNGYGHDRSKQTYTFEDGTTAPMDIVVNNNFYNVMVAGRYFLSQGTIQPYINGKVGYSFFNTKLSIYDPNDEDQCEPVESEVLYKDGTTVFSAGGGLRLDLLPKRSPGLVYINLSANYTIGGKVGYMNVDASNHNHVAHTSDVYAQFINTQTQVVHDHHVGNVYSSPLEFMDFRLGATMRLSKR